MSDTSGRIERSAIVGAAGKMGSGIAFLLLKEQLLGTLNGEYECPRLVLLDNEHGRFRGLSQFLRTQLKKYGERHIGQLRSFFSDASDLVENGEIIAAFVERGMALVEFSTTIESASESRVVFEAVFESLDVKREVYSKLKKACSDDCYFLSNTSSIPIKVIAARCGLGKQLAGFHFYNPPVVQELIEMIVPDEMDTDYIDFCESLTMRFGKTCVKSNDTAGFIGNGHFIREGVLALRELDRLGLQMDRADALVLIDSVTRNLLIRPMGIFQLIDYVGLDVFDMIAQVMSGYLGEPLDCQRVQAMLELGHVGGQFPDGSQRDGFFQYKGGKISGVFSFRGAGYVDFSERDLSLPQGHASWKQATRMASWDANAYFDNLRSQEDELSQYAWDYLIASRNIATQLVKDGVASSEEDVDRVLKLGFFHPYGIISATSGMKYNR